jgi:hypothetical protein
MLTLIGKVYQVPISMGDKGVRPLSGAVTKGGDARGGGNARWNGLEQH